LYSHVNGSGVWGSGRVFTVTETGTKITLDGYINLVAVTSTLHPWLQESVLAGIVSNAVAIAVEAGKVKVVYSIKVVVRVEVEQKFQSVKTSLAVIDTVSGVGTIEGTFQLEA